MTIYIYFSVILSHLLTVMDWPQSPDLNIIEAEWDHLDRQINIRQPTYKKSTERSLV